MKFQARVADYVSDLDADVYDVEKLMPKQDFQDAAVGHKNIAHDLFV